MSKKNLTAIDFDFGIGQIIPSTQESYRRNEADMTIRKEEKTGHNIFKERLINELIPRLKNNAQFPTNKEVFIFILQYFIAEKEYARRDIDNMAKTILDILKGRFYTDDSQVKTLLVGKKIEHKISQNFAYVAIKELSSSQDVDALKISGIERSVTMFQELKNKGIL